VTPPPAASQLKDLIALVYDLTYSEWAKDSNVQYKKLRKFEPGKLK